jgi:quinol-cytochrome oxidoreductase complex cytochrome b subunit
MNWNIWIRQFHRWLAIAFTVGFIANLITVFTLGRGEEAPFWMYLLVLIPLFLLMPTGLYMFMLPYAAKWRGARHVGAQE